MAVEDRERISNVILRDKRTEQLGSRGRCILRDSEYLKYRMEEVMEAVKHSDVIKREYIADFYDCDDKADALAADIRWKCIGIAFGTVTFWYYKNDQWAGHVMCIFYDADRRRFRFIEPEDGSTKMWQKSWKVGEVRF